MRKNRVNECQENDATESNKITQKKNPLISVVIPLYKPNFGYFRECLSSVRSQTLSNFEIILISDFISNEIRAYVESINDERIKLIENKEKLGFQKSLNKGVKLSKGEYIARMDSDDICYSNRFEDQIKFFEENKDYALAGSNIIIIDENGRKIGIRNFPHTYSEIKSKIHIYITFSHSAVMFKRDAFNKLGGYDENIKEGEDYDLWLRFVKNYKCGNINKPLLCYRYSFNTLLTGNVKNAIKGTIKVKLRAVKRYGYVPTPLYLVSILLFLIALLFPQKYTLIIFNKLIELGVQSSTKFSRFF